MDPNQTWRTAILKERAVRGKILCALEAGELFGDVELVCELETYSTTVVCSTTCEVFRIKRKQLEKIIKKNVTVSLEMRSLTLAKLSGRSVKLDIPLYRRLTFNLNNQNFKRREEFLPNLKVTKRLPDDEQLFLHQLHR